MESHPRRSARRRPVSLKRGAPDRLLPGDFAEVLTHRYLPVLAMTYIANILGVAAAHGRDGGGVLTHLLHNPSPYRQAIYVALWVSIPAIVWIILKGSLLWSWHADVWYKGLAFMMASTAIVAYILFPEDFFQGMRLFFVASIPVFFVQYYFFVRGGMPGVLAWPLTLGAAAAFVWGLFV